MTFHTDPSGRYLPIKLDATSNGEFVPVPLGRMHHEANALAHAQASRNAEWLGLGRRDFLVSLCGAASTLLAFNTVYAGNGREGGYFALSPESALDPQLAEAELGGKEFIFDVQGHFVNPTGDWLKQLPKGARPYSGRFFPKADCKQARQPGELGYLHCLGPEEFVKDVFLDSDTDLMVLSFVPSHRDAEPVTIEEAAAVADIVDRLDGTHRLLLHGRVNPNQAGDLKDMERLATQYPIAAWKTYTQWGPDGNGFWMTDEPGIRMVEEARRLGIKRICIHKGIPFGGMDGYRYSLCDDIGPIARRYPDVDFLIYHSGWEMDTVESAYQPQAQRSGIDSLVRSVEKAGLGHNSNVYAELGSTWRFLMRDPDQAAHALGKLLKHLGEDNVLWGTDSIWYGSPQDQIQAFRSFAISEKFRERYGYPALTPRLKAKVFGLNAARVYKLDPVELKQFTGKDALARQQQNYRNNPQPHFRTYGPKTRREFLNLLRWNGGHIA